MNYYCFNKVFSAWLFCCISLVRAQTISQLIAQTPQCALPCFLDVVPAASCSLTDVGALSSCLCTNDTLLTDLSGCVRLSCPIPDQIQASSLLDQLCQQFPTESRAPVLKVLAILAIAVSVPSITLRWVARYQSSKLGWDDYTALAAAVCLIALAAIQLASVYFGFGRHVWEVDPKNAIPLLQLYWISQQLYIFAQLLIKVSTLALYARVFPVRWFRTAVTVFLVFMVVQDTIYILSVMVRCIPIQAIWDIRTPGQCLNLNAIGLTGAILGIVEHFIILLLPLPELWKLKLSRRKRLQLALVFSIGSFSCITSIIRLKYVAIFAPTVDLSWDTVPVVTWSLIEELSAVVCINLPPCRHLIGHLFPRQLLTSVKHTQNTTTNGAVQPRSVVGYIFESEDKQSTPWTGPGQTRGSTTTLISSTGGFSGKEKYRPKTGLTVSTVSPVSPPRSLRAASMVMVRREGVEFESLGDVEARRPYTAHGEHILDVEIDRSGLGFWELVRTTRWVPSSAKE